MMAEPHHPAFRTWGLSAAAVQEVVKLAVEILPAIDIG